MDSGDTIRHLASITDEGVFAAAIAFTGVAVAATRGRGWLALPALVTAFLFQHAVQGWCPPVPILRRFGFRTSYEIEEEREALKALSRRLHR